LISTSFAALKSVVEELVVHRALISDAQGYALPDLQGEGRRMKLNSLATSDACGTCPAAAADAAGSRLPASNNTIRVQRMVWCASGKDIAVRMSRLCDGIVSGM